MPSDGFSSLAGGGWELSVYRTFSWERILHKGVEDIDDEWGLPTALTFSPSGNLLALGHVTGQVSIINLENGTSTRAYDCSTLKRRAKDGLH